MAPGAGTSFKSEVRGGRHVRALACPRRFLRRAALLAVAACALAVGLSDIALAANGDLTQKAGIAGCISEDGTGGACADGAALDNAASVTVSPDGTSAYVASPGPGAVAVFDRDPATGALTQKPAAAGCISDDGSGGACADGVALQDARSVTVAPDGFSVYVASENSDAVAVFDRNTATGSLTQKFGTAGCISEDGTGGACTNGAALGGARSVTVSPDGFNVYVASAFSSAVAVFDRAPTTNEIAQKPPKAGCVAEIAVPGGACTDGTALDRASSVTVSPDGTSAYVASSTSNAVAVFDRNTATGELTQEPGTAGCISEDGTGGACTDGTALDRASSVTVSPDGKSAYVASFGSNAVAVFDRDPTTGELNQRPGTAGCISETGTGGACIDGKALDNPFSVTVSPDGKSAYVGSFGSNAVAVFDRDPTTGELDQRPGTAGCVSEDGTGGACADGLALLTPFSVTVSPDGKSAYVASFGSDAVAVFDRETDATVDGSATAKKKQKPKGKKIVVKVKVKASEDLEAKGSGKVKVKKKSYKLGPQTKSVGEGTKKTLKLKPKKSKDTKRIAKALKRGRKATAKLEVKLSDEAGNKKTTKLKVKLKG